jgi:precorrin-6Y C5,15-methyltransferase (decarboxylating)
MTASRRVHMPPNITFFPPWLARLEELDKTEPIPPMRIAVVGIEPTGRNSLSSEAAEIVETANLLVGGKRQLGYFRDHSARKLAITDDPSQVLEPIRRALEREQAVVVLASGDPMLYGIGVMLVREFGVDRVSIYPAPSSVQLAFAKLGEPWHDVTILSAHGRPLPDIVPVALTSMKMAILTDAQNTPGAIAGALMGAGMEDCRAVVGEELGGPHERVVETTLHSLPRQKFATLNILLLFREPASVRLRFGLPDDGFQTVRGQITKAEVRAVTLSKLRLAPHGVLWDVGAGCGSISIEAALLMPRGTVYAIERDPEQRACLAQNIARHGASNVQVVAGEAPDALAGLPTPDCVFAGGTGGRIAELLDCLPRPFVMNLALAEHVGLVLERFPRAEAVQLSAARSSPIGKGHRLAALNPVFIVSVPQ